MKRKAKTNGLKENWIKEESIGVLRAETEKKNGRSKMNEIGKKYERVPHPTLKNTFILKEKKS